MTFAIVEGYVIAICIATVVLKGLAPIARLRMVARRALAAYNKNLAAQGAARRYSPRLVKK